MVLHRAFAISTADVEKTLPIDDFVADADHPIFVLPGGKYDEFKFVRSPPGLL